MYGVLARNLLIDLASNNVPGEEVIRYVREFLFNAVLQRSPGQAPESPPMPLKLQDLVTQVESENSDVVKYLLIAHYYQVRNSLKNADLKGTAVTV